MKAFWQNIGIALSAAIGAVISIMGDLIQKQDASATLKLSAILARNVMPRITPLAVVCFLIVLAVAIAFIFKANTGKEAFYRGLSVISLLMLATPYQLPQTLPQGAPGVRVGMVRGVDVAAGVPGPGVNGLPASLAQVSGSVFTPVHVRLETSDHRPVSNITAILIDPSTSRVLGSLRREEDEFTFFTRPGAYLLRIEAPGYFIVTYTLRVEKEQRNFIRITLQATWLPIFLQRLPLVSF